MEIEWIEQDAKIPWDSYIRRVDNTRLVFRCNDKLSSPVGFIPNHWKLHHGLPNGKFLVDSSEYDWFIEYQFVDVEHIATFRQLLTELIIFIKNCVEKNIYLQPSGVDSFNGFYDHSYVIFEDGICTKKRISLDLQNDVFSIRYEDRISKFKINNCPPLFGPES